MTRIKSLVLLFALVISLLSTSVASAGGDYLRPPPGCGLAYYQENIGSGYTYYTWRIWGYSPSGDGTLFQYDMYLETISGGVSPTYYGHTSCWVLGHP